MIKELLVECRVTPSVGSVRAVRREIAAALTPVVSPGTIRDAVLVVSELCTNAIEAVDEGSCDVIVRVGVPSAQWVCIEVEDCGAGFALEAERKRAGEADESGRGLSIVSSMADDLEVEHQPDCTIVRASLRRNETLELARDLK